MFGTLEYYLNVFDGRWDWPESLIESRDYELSQLKDGTQICVRIGRIPHPRTGAQLKAFWGLFIATVLAELNDRGYDSSFLLNTNKPTGIPIDRELLKSYMYNVCPVFREERRITLSSMSVEEACGFYDNCCNFVASQWQIYIPETDKNWREKKDPYKELRK